MIDPVELISYCAPLAFVGYLIFRFVSRRRNAAAESLEILPSPKPKLRLLK